MDGGSVARGQEVDKRPAACYNVAQRAVISAQGHYRSSDRLKIPIMPCAPHPDGGEGTIFCAACGVWNAPYVFERAMAATRDDGPAGFRESAASLRLLPLALSAIWAVTALPVDVSSFAADGHFWRAGLKDFVGNVALYVPLGFALRRCAWWRALVIAAGVSVLAECSQLWYPERFAAGNDVAANVGGVLLGYTFGLGASRLPARGAGSLELTRGIAAAAVLLFVAAVFVLTRPGRPADFSNWDPECRVVAGDELTRNRPWRGEIHEAAVFQRSFGGNEIRRLWKAGTRGELGKALGGLSPVYAYEPSAPLDSVRGTPLMGAAEHERFFRALVESGKMCVIVHFRSSSERQSGPARIFGYSKTPWAQNFVLGQEGRDVVFRLRTPTTLPGGFSPQTRVRGAIQEGKDLVVAATYDGRNVRVFVDGTPRARLNLSARGRTSRSLADTGLPGVAFLLGVLMGTGWVAAAGRLKRGNCMVWGALGGGLGGIAFILAGGADALPGFAPWVPLIGAWGGATVGGSVTSPSSERLRAVGPRPG